MTKRALILWGGWQEHTPEACALRVRDMLAPAGFEVDLGRDLGGLSGGTLSSVDLIVPIMTNATLERDQMAEVIAAVEAGTGLAGFHGGMCDAFRSEVAWQFMTGGNWVAHPGDFIDFRVEITDRDDPVMQGIDDFDYRSEQYFMHVDPGNTVLATTRFTGQHCAWVEGTVMPVVWKRQHGRGRIFYSSLGHNAAEFDHPQMAEIFRRGALWAAGA